MNVSLNGKRLLVLGGSLWKQAIRDYADQNGIILISAGLYPAGIDSIAEEVYRIDTTDKAVMIPFIKEHQIDGVYMGGSELIISHACQYINDLHLPCYCTKDQWDFLQEKDRFKALCMRFGLPCVPRYELDSNIIDYPVITKPTDGCGSNGFSVCRNYEELKQGYKVAAEASPTGRVLIEKFVKNDSVVVFYTFSNGRMVFSGLENKYPVKYEGHGSYVAGLHLFESQYVNDFRSRFDDKLEKMFSSLGIKEGSAWIEVFHDGEDYYFNEVGFRYSGSVSIYPVDYFYGINQVSSDIYYALTGNSSIFNHSSLIKKDLQRKKHYAIFNAHMLPGTIASIDGVEIIRQLPECVFIAVTKHVGDSVKATGTVAQIFAFIHFVFDTIEECREIIDRVYSEVHVVDHDGNELLCNMIDWNSHVISL